MNLDCLKLDFSSFQHPRGENVPRFSRLTLSFRQTGLDILNLDPKTTRFYPAAFHCLCSICDWEVFVSLTPSLGVCLPDTCLAWPGFALISSVSVRTREGHLPILLCESLPALCLCQQFGTDSPTQSPVFTPGPTGQRWHISPNRQRHLNAHKSLAKVTPSQTTRHDRVTNLNAPDCSVIGYKALRQEESYSCNLLDDDRANQT